MCPGKAKLLTMCDGLLTGDFPVARSGKPAPHCFAAAQPCLTSEFGLSRGDDVDVRKICAIPGGVPRDKRPLLNFSMRSDVKIRQGRSFHATASTVFQKSLRREPPGGVRQRQPLKDRRIKPPVQIGGICKSRCQFCVDDRVYENWPPARRPYEIGFPTKRARPGRRSRCPAARSCRKDSSLTAGESHDFLRCLTGTGGTACVLQPAFNRCGRSPPRA
jgi:hypothetical protein